MNTAFGLYRGTVQHAVAVRHGTLSAPQTAGGEAGTALAWGAVAGRHMPGAVWWLSGMGGGG